ncbi:MAG: hypothetical protein N2482_01265 [Patescibacteria group bacterium]|nr:hypothetical protein [Patescibacteria group bacterium]
MEKQQLIHQLEVNKNKNSSFYFLPFISYLGLAIGIGIFTGFLFSKFKFFKKENKSFVKTEKAVGIADKKTFRDKAEGILREGGIDGEGNFHLERLGGKSQNVYLTSTTVDLSQYLNKKVRVWGETFQGEKAGWLMDVGLVEILK